jgi:hypothetical protein
MPTPKYKPGQSGNPNGRPKDKTPATQLRKSISEAMPDIINKLIEQAKEGDIQAAKVLLDRVCPTLKAQAIPVDIATGDNLAETGGNVINATMAGLIPPDIGSQLITALAAQTKIIEQQEVIERLQRIERQLENRKS